MMLRQIILLITLFSACNSYADHLVLCEEKRGLSCSISNERGFDPSDHNPIIIKGNLTIKKGAEVTFDPGIIIKFASKIGSITIENGGTLNAQGTAENPITFTSINDIGEDGFKDYEHKFVSPRSNDWRGIKFVKGSRGRLDHIKLKFSGRSTRKSSIEVNSGDVSITNSKISDGYGYPVTLHGSACSALLKNNTFVQNHTDSVLLSSCRIEQSTVLDGDVTYISSGLFQVLNNVTLRLKPGAIIKFQKMGLRVLGRLVSDGTFEKPVILTSLHDDSVGGDSNANGNRSQPTSYDWSGIKFSSKGYGNWLNNTVIKYAGYSNLNHPSIINYAPELYLSSVNIIHTGNNPEIRDVYNQGQQKLVAVNSIIRGQASISIDEDTNTKRCIVQHHVELLKNVASPSCSLQWDYHHYLNIANPLFENQLAILRARQVREVEQHEMMEKVINIASTVYSLNEIVGPAFTNPTIDGVAKRIGLGMFEIPKALVMSSVDSNDPALKPAQRNTIKITQEFSEALLTAGQLLVEQQLTGSIKPEKKLIEKTAHLVNHFNSLRTVLGLTEDIYNIAIAENYIHSLLKHGGNHSELARELGLPLNASMKSVVAKIGKDTLQIENSWWNKNFKHKDIEKIVATYDSYWIGRTTAICGSGLCSDMK